MYAVRLFNRVGFGRLDNSSADWQRTRWGERLPAVVLSVLVVLAGLWPPALVGWSEASTAGIALRRPAAAPLAPSQLLASASAVLPSPRSAA